MTSIKTTQRGLQDGWTRATFILRKHHLEELKALAYWERKTIKDVMDEALGAYQKEKNRTREEKEKDVNGMKKIAISIFFVFLVIVMVSLVVFGTISANAQNRTKDVKEWSLLRGNEEAHKGKIVTWKCFYYGESPRSGVCHFRLKDDLIKVVHVSVDWKDSSVDWLGIYTKINKGDIFEIKGEFLGVKEFDYHTGIYMKPIKMKKIGFVE